MRTEFRKIINKLKPVRRKVEQVEPRPRVSKLRHRCPFYGFSHPFGGIFMDSGGNQCALLIQSLAPCPMETRGQIPDWEKCFSIREDFRSALEESMDTLRVFPEEFRPEDQSSWNGMPFRQWMEYVMDGNIERP